MEFPNIDSNIVKANLMNSNFEQRLSAFPTVIKASDTILSNNTCVCICQ